MKVGKASVAAQIEYLDTLQLRVPGIVQTVSLEDVDVSELAVEVGKKHLFYNKQS